MRRRESVSYDRPVYPLFAVLAFMLLGPPSQRVELKARFIGQMAFEITDGSFTVMTDFPYQIGYAGAPDFAPNELGPRTPQTLALITHRHMDHWQLALFQRTNWRVLGPSDATRSLAADRVVAPSGRVTVGPVVIEPLET